MIYRILILSIYLLSVFYLLYSVSLVDHVQIHIVSLLDLYRSNTFRFMLFVCHLIGTLLFSTVKFYILIVSHILLSIIKCLLSYIHKYIHTQTHTHLIIIILGTVFRNGEYPACLEFNLSFNHLWE